MSIFVTETYLDAIRGCNNRLEDTTYETEAEAGKGKRRKKVPAKLQSSDSEDEGTRRKKIPKKKEKVAQVGKVEVVPPPPMIKTIPTGESTKRLALKFFQEKFHNKINLSLLL